MIVWTYAVLAVICMRFKFLYLYLFSTIKHVTHGKALEKYNHYHCYYYKNNLQKVIYENGNTYFTYRYYPLYLLACKAATFGLAGISSMDSTGLLTTYSPLSPPLRWPSG